MNYFEFFDLPVAFKIDEAALKQRFYERSRRYHPDFYTLESDEKQAEILELSTFNNEAYQTLADFDRRVDYLLRLRGALAEEGQNEIPQDFLMEMMDLNEVLMELEMDFDAALYQKALQELEHHEKTAFEEVAHIIGQYDDKKADPTELSAVRDFYLKKRYLLRIQENLAKFAPH